MADLELESIIDYIYEAATNTREWSDALDQVRKYFRARCIVLYAVNRNHHVIGQVHPGVDPEYETSYREWFVKNNPWVKVPELMRPGVLRIPAVLERYHNEPGYLTRTSYYNEWLVPQKFHHSVSSTISSGEESEIRFSLHRGQDAGEFSTEELDGFQALCRHLMRASRILNHLPVSNLYGKDLQHLLEQLEAAVLFVGPQGCITGYTAAAEQLLARGDSLLLSRGRIVAQYPADNRQLQECIKSAIAIHNHKSNHESCQAPACISIHRKNHSSSLVLRIIPLPKTECFLGSTGSAAAILVCEPRQHTVSLRQEMLQQRYGLTGAESGLLRYLIQGYSLRESAEARSISYETARGYLKSIFQKTGTSRQTELICQLLAETTSL